MFTIQTQVIENIRYFVLNKFHATSHCVCLTLMIYLMNYKYTKTIHLNYLK